jgi:glyoxylase-like metal-dependent hydrolase (beta-lactamase superfamily II)
VQELRSGLWTWTAPHPEWTEADGGTDGWGRVVRSYAYDSGACLVLVDPIAPPSLLEELVEAKDVAVILTVHWHERATNACVERFGAHVHAPAGSIERVDARASSYEPGDELPGGIVAYGTGHPREAVLWLPAHHALATGDVLLGGDTGPRLRPDDWTPEGSTPGELREALRPLLDLPLELLLLTHGDPVGGDARGALEAALGV